MRKRPHSIKNQKGLCVAGEHYDKILNAHFQEQKSVKIDDTYIDIKGATIEADRTVIEVYIHGL